MHTVCMGDFRLCRRYAGFAESRHAHVVCRDCQISKSEGYFRIDAARVEPWTTIVDIQLRARGRNSAV